jgi:hypothetical protein
MLDRNQKDDAMAKAIKMAELDFATNGAYTNAPYTILTDGLYLKARIRHGTTNDQKRVVRLELYQPETNVGSHELSVTDEPTPRDMSKK